MTNHYPVLSDFLKLPRDEIRKFAPQSLIMSNGGSRRRAVIKGIDPNSDDYMELSRQEMISCFDLIFQHGVRHIITGVLTEANYNEITPKYREKLVEWTHEGLTNTKTLAEYERLNWKVALIGAESWPGLEKTAQILEQETGNNLGPRLWLHVASNAETHWMSLLKVSSAHNLHTREDVIRIVYGEDIPLANLYIGSGKPQILASSVPPLLVGHLECYCQFLLGYNITESTLRRILYDFAFVRKTWQEDKAGRAEKILDYQELWSDPPILGEGTRIGPFWYPAVHSEVEIRK